MVQMAPDTNRLFTYLFMIYGAIGVLFFALLIPPFQNPDEPAHFMRASQLARGEIIVKRPTDADGTAAVGGYVDRAIFDSFGPFQAIPFRADRKVNQAMWQHDAKWSGSMVFADFRGAAVYPPLFYLPAVAAVAIGQAADLTVIRTLLLSRLFNGLVAVALGALAIRLCGEPGIWLFALLTLPMSIELISSPSQDGLMLPTTAIAGALAFRSINEVSSATKGTLVAMTIALTAVAMARPPYVFFGLVLPFLRGYTWPARLTATTLAVAITAGWSVVIILTSFPNLGEPVGANPSAQISYLVGQPTVLFTLFLDTLSAYGLDYLHQFIGVLGWLDTALPNWYYGLAEVLLGVTFLAELILGRGTGELARSAVLAVVILSIAAVLGIQYLSWTKPAAPLIEGVQGRYFLPIALFAVALLPGRHRILRLQWFESLMVGVFPVISLAVGVRAIIVRYYLM